MTYLKIITIISALLITFNSIASSEMSWKALDKAVEKRCFDMSQMQKKKQEGNRIDFNDNVGYSAIIITGEYSVRNGKLVPAKELCLYNRSNKSAILAEIR